MSTITYGAKSIQEKIASLEAALLSDTPEAKLVLASIHKQLQKDPDVVTILTEEEIGQLVGGLSKVTGHTITAKAMAAPRNKPLRETSIDDI